MALSVATESLNEVTNIFYRMQSGDTNAFNELYTKTVKFVHYTVMGAGVPSADVDDVVQDTFIYIFNKYDTCKEPKAALSWIKKVAFSRSVDYLRKNNREMLLSDEEGDYVFEESTLVSPIDLPEDVVENKATRQLINDILNKLPQKQLLIVRAFYFNDKKTREIAEEMNIPEGTVKASLARSRKTLEGEINSLAKKHGIKLVAFAIFPVLGTVFSEEAHACAIGSASMSGVYNASVAGSRLKDMGVSPVLKEAYSPETHSSATTSSQSTARATIRSGSATTGKPMVVKVASIIAGATVAVGGTVLAVNMIKEPTPPKDTPPVVVASAEQSSEERDVSSISDEARRLERLFAEQGSITEEPEQPSSTSQPAPIVQPEPSSTEPETEEEEENVIIVPVSEAPEESKEPSSEEQPIPKDYYGHEIKKNGEQYFVDENGVRYNYPDEYEHTQYQGVEVIRIKKSGVMYKVLDEPIEEEPSSTQEEPSSSQSP